MPIDRKMLSTTFITMDRSEKIKWDRCTCEGPKVGAGSACLGTGKGGSEEGRWSKVRLGRTSSLASRHEAQAGPIIAEANRLQTPFTAMGRGEATEEVQIEKRHDG